MTPLQNVQMTSNAQRLLPLLGDSEVLSLIRDLDLVLPEIYEDFKAFSVGLFRWIHKDDFETFRETWDFERRDSRRSKREFSQLSSYRVESFRFCEPSRKAYNPPRVTFQGELFKS